MGGNCRGIQRNAPYHEAVNSCNVFPLVCHVLLLAIPHVGSSLSLYNTTDPESSFFNQAQLLTGNLNGTYNIICFSVAFALIPIAHRLGAKRLHFVSLALGGIGMLCMPLLNDTDLLFTLPFGDGIAVSQIYLFSFALGITWASMMAMPYEM